jgi:hypothetical protein
VNENNAIEFRNGYSNTVLVISNNSIYGSGSNLTGITADQVGALAIGGGTVTGAVYTTVDHSASSPTDNELATAGWVRDLFPVTATYYSSSNDNTVVTNLGFTCRVMSEEIPILSSGEFTTGLTNNGYLASIATTQKVNATGNAVINAYISAIGNNPLPSLTIHPEIYATADGTTLYGDWDVQNQTITLGGTTNLYTFVIPIGSITNSYVVRRWKIGTANNITSIRFHNGTNGVDTASRMGLTVSATPVEEYVLTAAKIASAGGLTNVTTEAIVQAGAITNSLSDPYMTPTNLLGLISGTTMTWTRAYGNAGYLTPTDTVYFAADATMTDTNGLVGFSLDLFYNGQTFGFVGASVTNTATLTSNAWNSIIFWKGRGSSVFVGK